MEFPVCKLWLLLIKKYDTMQPFKKFSKEYSLSYNKVREYGSNTFNKIDEEFVNKLCDILECDFEELFEDNKESYYDWRFKRNNKINHKKGVVYFIKNGDGLTKIGRTGDLKKRLYSLRYEENGLGFDLQLVHFIETDDNKVLEKTLHKVFSDKCVKGEWFNLTTEDLEKIKGVK